MTKNSDPWQSMPFRLGVTVVIIYFVFLIYNQFTYSNNRNIESSNEILREHLDRVIQDRFKKMDESLMRLSLETSSAKRTLEEVNKINQSITKLQQGHENSANDIILTPVDYERSKQLERDFWRRYYSGYYTKFED
jgi:low affinity Fe/Cu permease